MDSIEHPKSATGAVIKDVLHHLTELGIRLGWRYEENIENRICTGTLLLDDGTGVHEFPAVASATVSPTELTLLPHDEQTVLLTRHITPARAQALAARGWGGYADSAGNASLRSPGLLIEIAGRSDTGANRTATAAPFSRAGLPVTFAVLIANQQNHRVNQRELAASSGASIGTVNRVVRALRERTPPMLDKNNRVLRPAALEDEWVAAYSTMQPSTWPEERFTSDIWKDPSDLLKVKLPHGALLGSELAAARLGALIRPSQALVHLLPTLDGTSSATGACAERPAALDATDDDIVAAASYHYARRAAEAFAPVDGKAVLDTLRDARLRPVVLRHMRSELAADLLDGYSKGFAAGLER